MKQLINRLHRSRILSLLFPTQLSCLRHELRHCQSVLDIGCGPSSPLQHCQPFQLSVGVEPFIPYLKRSRQQQIHHHYISLPFSKLKFPPNSFDAVIALEVIEHLPKTEAEILLKNARLWARQKVIITTPNGYYPQISLDDNPLQKHLSGWTATEMRRRNYKVFGLAGFKFFRWVNPRQSMDSSIYDSIRFRPRLLWFIICTVSQALAYRLPNLAFEIFCVNSVKSSQHLSKPA